MYENMRADGRFLSRPPQERSAPQDNSQERVLGLLVYSANLALLRMHRTCITWDDDHEKETTERNGENWQARAKRLWKLSTPHMYLNRRGKARV